MLTIRAAEMNDAAALAQLMCELGYETTTGEMHQRLDSVLSDTRCSTFLAELNGGVCGMIGTLAHASHEDNDVSGKIVALVVSKKQRRSRYRPRSHCCSGGGLCKPRDYSSESNNSIQP
jgi:hypothetical protein